MDLVEKESEEDERRLKNLATRIMSNGVEVLVKDKNPDGKQEQVNTYYFLTLRYKWVGTASIISSLQFIDIVEIFF